MATRTAGWRPGVRMLDATERTRLRRLVRGELPRLYALAAHLGGVDPEELVQETMVRACKSFPSLRDVQAGPKWLTTILTNVWRDALRQRGRRPDEVALDPTEDFSLYQQLVDEDPWPYSDTMHVDFLGAFSEQDIQEVLHRVPLLHRAPLVLRYVEGHTVREVADILDRPPGTIMSQLYRGRQQFEWLLWEYATESGLVPAPASAAGGATT